METILKKELWSTVPVEVLHIILSYSNEVKYRNGKYIDRLNQEKDNRFRLLKSSSSSASVRTESSKSRIVILMCLLFLHE